LSEADILKSYVPDFILQSAIFQEIYNVQGGELDSLNNAVNDILNQCFIDSATWGLNYWESFAGIITDETKPYEYRRSVVKSKVRGYGTVNIGLIESVAESYANGQVQITEHNDLYSFDVKFISTVGQPPNLSDLQNAIEIIKPAHLAVTYTFIYNTYQILHGFTNTHLQAYTHAQLRGSVIT
jgi:hypothetical protein